LERRVVRKRPTDRVDGSARAVLSEAFAAELIPNLAREVATAGFGIEEGLVLFFGNVEVAIDVAASEPQIEGSVPTVICRRGSN
jgi:hypothetical protein